MLVHNGIIENYLELKNELLAEGNRFSSETDSEVIAHLVARELAKQGTSLEQALMRVTQRLAGIYAICAMHKNEPGKIVGARVGPPLVVGVGEGESFLASDLTALLEHTRDVVFLEDHETVVLTAKGITLYGADGRLKQHKVSRINWDPVAAEKGGFRHFMLKEIHEQPRAVNDTLAGRISLDRGEVSFSQEEFPLTDVDLNTVDRMCLVACGTSWHASLVGKFLIEKLAGLPVEVDYASEFRYREPLIGPKTLMTIVTQSGETADTLAALREAKQRGSRSVAICNVMGSTATREAHGTILTHCGPEIGVASTKAFTAQLIALYLLALRIGAARGRLTPDHVREHLTALAHVPSWMERTLECDEQIQEVARCYKDASDFLYLGRGINYPIALEGALKLKEISYIHAEAYPAGELKHGPLALVTEAMPVVVVAPKDTLIEKLKSNLQEVRARGGELFVFADADSHINSSEGVHVIRLPEHYGVLSPILHVVPLQLLAYHTATARGTDVDKPRNLAKSVTVE